MGRLWIIGLATGSWIAACSRTPDGLVQVRDANGRLAVEVERVGGTKDGAARFFHPDGAVMKEGRYRHDLKDGEWNAWDPEGGRLAQMNYSQGRFHGICRWWAPNGTLVAEEPYDHGSFHGTLRRWFPDGHERQVAQFDHGKAFGDYVRHVREGDTLRHGTVITGFYLDGKSHGMWTGRTGDGRLMSEGRFDHGIRVGTWRFWDRKGRLVKEIDYVNGGEAVVRDLSREARSR